MYTIQFWNSFWKRWPKLGVSLAGSTSNSGYIPGSDLSDRNSYDALSFQEKYEYLAEYGTHILCLVNSETGCTYLSRNFTAITGLHAQNFYGHSLQSLIHHDYVEPFKKILSQLIPHNHPVHWRCKLQHADKKYYWYSFLIHSKHGGKEGEYVCIMENVHDGVQAQNILQKAKLEAEFALRSRSEFLSNMSHELRTPLNAIIGFSQIIENQIFGKIEHPQYNEYIRHIHESGYDLLAKIEDLLEIANIDAGRVTLSREEVHIKEIFRHVIETQAHHAMSARITLETASMPPDIRLFVDRLKLQHILGHLVANALKFSPHGTIISLNATLVEQGLRICVRDTGTGMTSGKLNAITMALQEDNCWSAAHDNQSIGLGLALTREFVVLHGGEVSVDSKPAEGTTITINLPKECLIVRELEEAGYAQAVG